MKKLQYRSSDYFNQDDEYLFYNNDYYFLSKTHNYNGSWFTNIGLNWKCITLKAINIKELIND